MNTNLVRPVRSWRLHKIPLKRATKTNGVHLAQPHASALSSWMAVWRLLSLWRTWKLARGLCSSYDPLVQEILTKYGIYFFHFGKGEAMSKTDNAKTVTFSYRWPSNGQIRIEMFLLSTWWCSKEILPAKYFPWPHHFRISQNYVTIFNLEAIRGKNPHHNANYRPLITIMQNNNKTLKALITVDCW